MSHAHNALLPESADEYLDVLVLCSAPVDLRPSLNLAQELANFEDEIRRSPLPIRLRRVFPPTLDQLQRELSPTGRCLSEALPSVGPYVFALSTASIR